MSDKPPLFSRQISVGNVLQIGIMIVGLTIGWITMDLRSQGNQEALVTISGDVADLQTDIDSLDARLRNVETEQARADERFGSILAILSRIDARLERIEGNN